MLQYKRGARRPSEHKLTAACAAALLALAACSGGDGSINDTNASNDTVQLAGVVIDGPIQGAVVFLDLNNNLALDSGEPASLPTDAAGAFALVAPRLSRAQLATSMLVTHVPATAKDADDGGATLQEAGKKGFTMMSPVAAYMPDDPGDRSASRAVISPLTTLVAGEMAFNGQTLAEARASVQARLGLQEKDPMADFIAGSDAGLGSIARAAAVALGEAGKAIADVAQQEGGMAVRDQIGSTLQAVKGQLPSLISGLELSAGATPSASTIVAELSKPDAVAAVDAAVVEKRSVAGPDFQRFIVVFRSTVGDPAAESRNSMRGVNGKVEFTYAHAIKGFAVTLPNAAADAFIAAMARNPNVDYVEDDRWIGSNTVTQTSVTWGLDRADQRDLPLTGSYSYAATGAGVTAYIVDSGLRSTHADFAGRVAPGYTAINDGYGTGDCRGHGTHVAGTVGGTTWGVAKGVTIVPVRVLDCNGWGTTSQILAGIDWVVANAKRPAVVNMSLGGAASSTMDSAVTKAVSKGIPVVVSAGNKSESACNQSPAREPTAITVAATDSNDSRASFSNFGTCVDLFAPGSRVVSTSASGDLSTESRSGTSMASPHVAGLVAQLLQADPSASPAWIHDTVKQMATSGKVSDAGSGSPNLLLYVSVDASQPAPTTSEPAPTTSEPAPTTEEPSTTTGGALSVASLSGSSASVRNSWRAMVIITVKDGSGALVSGAVVAGGFTAGGSSVSCTTGSNGTCSITSGNINKKTASTTFSVDRISSNSTTSYDSGSNAVTSIVIGQP